MKSKLFAFSLSFSHDVQWNCPEAAWCVVRQQNECKSQRWESSDFWLLDTKKICKNGVKFLLLFYALENKIFMLTCTRLITILFWNMVNTNWHIYINERLWNSQSYLSTVPVFGRMSLVKEENMDNTNYQIY